MPSLSKRVRVVNFVESMRCVFLLRLQNSTFEFVFGIASDRYEIRRLKYRLNVSQATQWSIQPAPIRQKLYNSNHFRHESYFQEKTFENSKLVANLIECKYRLNRRQSFQRRRRILRIEKERNSYIPSLLALLGTDLLAETDQTISPDNGPSPPDFLIAVKAVR